MWMVWILLMWTGVGTNGGTAHIPPLQGFFVKTQGYRYLYHNTG